MEGTLYKDYKSIFDLLSWDMLRKGTKLGVFGNLDDLVRKYFSSDEAIKILEYSIGFLGGSPKITPALYQLMSYVDFSLGVWFPEGGMGRVATSIYELAVEHGAHVVLGEDVTEIRVKDGRATTVVTDKREIDADVVVVNGDYPYTELQLIPEEYQTYDKKYWDSRILAPSAFVAYVGTDTVNDKLRHHSLFLDRDWAKNFDEIFESDAPVWPKSPSYYVNVPSKTDPGLAPPGGETLFILVPLAPGLEDTPELRERFFNQIMDHLESVVDMPIRDHIVSKRIFAVNDYAHDYHAYKGTALSIVHTLKQTAVWRPAHQSKKVHNLYYTGQYTHPGIGVPMTLIASQIVSDLIDKNEQ
jgi:phytoene desaturase